MAVTQNDLGSQSCRFVVVDGRSMRVDLAALTAVVREIVQREVTAALTDRERWDGTASSETAVA